MFQYRLCSSLLWRVLFHLKIWQASNDASFVSLENTVRVLVFFLATDETSTSTRSVVFNVAIS